MEGTRLVQPALARRRDAPSPSGLDNLCKSYITGRCRGADEVEHLPGSHRKVFREVSRQMRRCAVGGDHSRRANGCPNAATEVVNHPVSDMFEPRMVS